MNQPNERFFHTTCWCSVGGGREVGGGANILGEGETESEVNSQILPTGTLCTLHLYVSHVTIM